MRIHNFNKIYDNKGTLNTSILQRIALTLFIYLYITQQRPQYIFIEFKGLDERKKSLEKHLNRQEAKIY